jgi:hypothetical protein
LKKKQGLTVKEGFVIEDGSRIMLRPLNLTNDTFHFVKSNTFQDSKGEEQNPVIGRVTLK